MASGRLPSGRRSPSRGLLANESPKHKTEESLRLEELARAEPSSKCREQSYSAPSLQLAHALRRLVHLLAPKAVACVGSFACVAPASAQGQRPTRAPASSHPGHLRRPCHHSCRPRHRYLCVRRASRPRRHVRPEAPSSTERLWERTIMCHQTRRCQHRARRASSSRRHSLRSPHQRSPLWAGGTRGGDGSCMATTERWSHRS